jgi:hypothetical protein
MRKTRLILGCLAVVAILAGLTGCMLPDYQLNTDVTITYTGDPAYSTVTYNLTNVGNKDLTNVQIGIEVDRVGYAPQYDTLGPFSINRGNTTTGTKNYYWGVTGADFVYITSVGWDSDN